MTTREKVTATEFLAGGGEMGERMRRLDWTQTPLGPIEDWPQTLRVCVSMMLASKAQIILFWGPEFVSVYNDGYIPVFGAKHPQMLGQPGRVAWSEIWDNMLRPLLMGVVETGNAFQAKDLEFVLERFGFVESTYFDVSYDPVRVESGEVGGVYCIVTETTGRVVGEQRLKLLWDLAQITSARAPTEACVRAMEVLAGSKPIPFAFAYLGGELVASTPDAQAALARTAADKVREVSIPGGKLVLGLNPRQSFDENYAAFVDLVAGQIGTAISNARAYEEERERAEALAELDRAKTAFFSNVSHEFRTPLTLLLGPVSQLLEPTDRSAEERTALELIERNALRLHKLVNTLLDFSRIEAGRIEARFAPVRLSELTADLASAFRSPIEHAGLALRVDVTEPPELAYVDREMWEKIVLNLMSNAFKHTFDGEIAVTLTSSDGEAILTVSDTGVGIPETEISHVFERFHRVPSARSRTHEGSGIGLSLVQELVRLHGGSISARSQVGVGSTFEVRIPLGSAHLPAAHVEHEFASPLSTEEHRVIAPYVREASSWSGQFDALVPERPDAISDSAALAGANVLVVDDNADMRQYISRLLAGAGASVREAGDGNAALELIEASVPNVILSDVMMPGLDGLGLLAALRADEQRRSIPFILLSARAGEESRIGGLAAGADDYLVKPFAAKELIARVASQLRLARAHEAERRALAEADEARREISRVFEQAPVAICVMEGPDLRYTSANAAYRQTIGGRDPIGKTLFELFPEAENTTIHDVLRQVMATATPYIAREFKVPLDLNGTGTVTDTFFNFIYHPLLDGQRRVRGVIAVVVDVTPQVLARKEAERLRVAAEEANQAKLHVLQTVSHETRQPVHASLGYVEMLQLGIRGALNESQLADLENIRKNQTHLLRLLNDILSFAKLEAGALKLDMEPADAADIMAQARPVLEPLFKAKGVTYEMRPPATPANFFGDRERTMQVCVNLLTNALKATESGGRVTFACDVSADRVIFSVTDTGIGIPQSKFDAIFDPFTQLARGGMADARGVGLGLSISRQLARAMNGDVTVDSTVGSGSTFTFSLPRADGAGARSSGMERRADAVSRR
jgi:signal transduction histidine kinase/CheY-like chemotaxis protein